MKKLIPVILALLLLAGCKIDTEIRADTIVDIPLDPTEATTEQITEAAQPSTEPTTEETTEDPTETPTDPPTEKATEKPKSSSNKSSSKKSSSKNSSNKKKDQNTKATDPTKSTKPTEPPTEAPTEVPTEAPTEVPTEAPTEAPTAAVVSAYSPTKLDKAIVTAINARRTDAGLPKLSSSKKLGNAAARRAGELPASWSHTRPDGSDFSTILAEFNIRAADCSENLYYTMDSISANDLVDKWMDSKQHRAIILSENFQTIGVANHTSDGVTYIAVLFIG